MAGGHIFLEDQFDRIGQVLHQACGAEAEDVGAIGAGAILEIAGAAALHPHADGDEAQGMKALKATRTMTMKISSADMGGLAVVEFQSLGRDRIGGIVLERGRISTKPGKELRIC
jgi:hypothetical protein